MNQTIILTESQLQRIIKESVRKMYKTRELQHIEQKSHDELLDMLFQNGRGYIINKELYTDLAVLPSQISYDEAIKSAQDLLDATIEVHNKNLQKYGERYFNDERNAEYDGELRALKDYIQVLKKNQKEVAIHNTIIKKL